MNTEWVWWLAGTIAFGVGVVLYLALGRVPEIEDEPAEDWSSDAGAEPGDGALGATVAPGDETADDHGGAVVADHGAADVGAEPSTPQSSPESTVVPGVVPSTTRETP